MSYEQALERALIADGEKLAVLTGEDHGPWDMNPTTCPKCGAASGNDWSQCPPHYPCPMGGPHSLPDDINPAAEVAELREQLATARAALEFYQDGFEFTTNAKYGGLEWTPTETLLEDCGNTARTWLISNEAQP